MEAKELRIGNWILNGINEEFQVNGITIDYFELGQSMFGEFKPIPLTEEWLIKFGFDKNINEMQVDGIEMKLQISGYDRDGSWFSSCGTMDGGLVVLCLCRGNYFSNNIMYVHQLQNVFFALTGEELTINQTV